MLYYYFNQYITNYSIQYSSEKLAELQQNINKFDKLVVYLLYNQATNTKYR